MCDEIFICEHFDVNENFANEIFSMHNNEIDQEAENNNENVPCTIMQIQANSRKRNEEISNDII